MDKDFFDDGRSHGFSMMDYAVRIPVRERRPLVKKYGFLGFLYVTAFLNGIAVVILFTHYRSTAGPTVMTAPPVYSMPGQPAMYPYGYPAPSSPAPSPYAGYPPPQAYTSIAPSPAPAPSPRSDVSPKNAPILASVQHEAAHHSGPPSAVTNSGWTALHHHAGQVLAPPAPAHAPTSAGETGKDEDAPITADDGGSRIYRWDEIPGTLNR